MPIGSHTVRRCANGMLTTNIADYQITICDDLTFLQPSSPTTMTFDEKKLLSVVMCNYSEGIRFHLGMFSTSRSQSTGLYTINSILPLK